MFPKLLETLPDADSLLRLEPEELAGPLLVSLEGDQEINPVRVIAHDHLSRSLQNRTELRQKYPPKHNNEILFRLMEAWQWLENEGFVALRPTRFSRETGSDVPIKYFVTRRGQEIETTEDLEPVLKVGETVISCHFRGEIN